MEEGEELGEHLLQLAYQNPPGATDTTGSKPSLWTEVPGAPDYTLF